MTGRRITVSGEYFRQELAVDNVANALWPEITVISGGTSESGHRFVARATEHYTHDADGNLLTDGRWHYEWDAENRLNRMRSLAGSPAPERRIEFGYDHQGRRVRQTVWNDRDDGQGSELSDLVYVYDGWNLLAELNANASNAKVRTHVWGLDLSGTPQGAGGVGGLLITRDATLATPGFAAYDGNGNVMALVSAADGTTSAHYEYGPFGESIRATGTMAESNPFRFSTKYQDEETDLLYYGYRSYNPSMGRWLNRDPIGELGFETLRRKRSRVNVAAGNLYGFVSNNPLTILDVLGLYEYEWESAFTAAEKQAIQDSINRVKDRASALIKQMDDNIKMLSKCPCPAYEDLINKLKGLKQVLEGMVKEIGDPGWNLEVSKESMPGVYASYWDSSVPWYDDELTLDSGWFGQGSSEQDSTMFHEITHGQGTDDGGANDYNNAHMIESLMHTEKEDWIIFKKDEKDADKKCNPAGK